MTPEERTRQSYAQALSLARGRLAIAVIELERAPVYLARPIAGAWERIDPRLQQTIDRLTQARREAQRHRVTPSTARATVRRPPSHGGVIPNRGITCSQ